MSDAFPKSPAKPWRALVVKPVTFILAVVNKLRGYLFEMFLLENIKELQQLCKVQRQKLVLGRQS